MDKRSAIRFGLVLAFLGLAVGLFMLLGLFLKIPGLSVLAQGLGLGAFLFLVLWLGWRLARTFLWRVGRRLALSYFLIGILPIPMVGLLALLNAYLLGGYFLGHLYRDAVETMRIEMVEAARERLGGRTAPADREDSALAFGWYRGGERVDGDERLPTDWPEWVPASKAHEHPPLVELTDGSPTLLVALGDTEKGILVFRRWDLQQELTKRSDVWVGLLRGDDPEKEGGVQLSLFSREFALQPLKTRRDVGARDAYFGEIAEGTPWRERPLVWWGELAGPLHAIEDGGVVSDYLAVSLNGTPATIFRHLFSSSAEVDTAVWASLIGITGLLSSIYLLAIVMAFYMIFSLSRAVNRLSIATDSVRKGDFSVRIPVRRRDQVGELQRSFNEMSANLERSVAAVAQKEVLEKELEIARNLQQSLLPDDLPASDAVDFATLFEPSAAIGGDYFDILRIDEDRLLVVIADVSGHGLSTGLRMAMLKAALVILVEERKSPVEIFRRLNTMVRAEREKRFFVTSALAVVDFRKGVMQLTNAGHPPTYLVRDGEVEEILLTGSPLGALGDDYGHEEVALVSGDVVVWLSDGIIEAANDKDEPFGYERTRSGLAGKAATAAEVRNRLLAEVARHTGGLAALDDKTLVAMRFLAPQTLDS